MQKLTAGKKGLENAGPCLIESGQGVGQGWHDDVQGLLVFVQGLGWAQKT